jgi:hypothetical protein
MPHYTIICWCMCPTHFYLWSLCSVNQLIKSSKKTLNKITILWFIFHINISVIGLRRFLYDTEYRHWPYKLYITINTLKSSQHDKWLWEHVTACIVYCCLLHVTVTDFVVKKMAAFLNDISEYDFFFENQENIY